MLPHLYVHYDDGAVSHLFHVAAGLDSMAVGEGQILGQTREALRLGQEQGTVGPALNVLFQQALRVGKRSRAETDIDLAAPSLVSAALERADAPLGGLAGKRVAGGRRRRDGRPGHRHRGPAGRAESSSSTAPPTTPSASPASTPRRSAPLTDARRRARPPPTW